MAWNWSHTEEAYANAERNLHALPIETLREIEAEWCAHSPSCYDDATPSPSDADDEGFSPARYALAHRFNANMDAETLAERIWHNASEAAVCDNGGFNAWACPYGCGPHTVSFDAPDEEAA